MNRKETLLLHRDGEPVAAGFEHWQAIRDAMGVCWLYLDQRRDGQLSSTNTLSSAVLQELSAVLEAVSSRDPRALVIRSLKPNGFIAGADINEFRDVTDIDDIQGRLCEAHAIMDELIAVSCPTIAVLHGQCLGGGLELALACDYRMARPDTRLGFPEVQLGLHPGLGGTARLPALISPPQALQMMLSGRSVDAARARALGLVDEVTEERYLNGAVQAAIAGHIKKSVPGVIQRLMSTGPARRIIAVQARRQLRSRASQDQYPAPFDLLSMWEEHGGRQSAMLGAERKSFARLLTSERSQNLIRVFFLREDLRASGKRKQASIEHVHIIGAGTMGGDIAAWCAHQGLRVTIEDQSAEHIAPAMARAASLFDYKYSNPGQWRAAWDRLMPDPGRHGRRQADLIIEAVPEKVELKRQVLADVEKDMKASAILATNTSGILIEDLRDALLVPERLAGLHFFNPVSRMDLIEIVGDDTVDTGVIERLTAFATRIDRLPVPVRSSPGFLVNRILTPYLLEALQLLDEGISPHSIDEAATRFGMPMGPITLADQIGLDICLDVADTLQEKLGQPLAPIPEWLRDKVERGELGVKTGKGLYEYQAGQPKTGRDNSDPNTGPGLADRMVLSLVNTAVACLGEGIVEHPDTIDGAMIFGTGFAPFRGGPIHYARQRGTDETIAALHDLQTSHGDRFAPSTHWHLVQDMQ